MALTFSQSQDEIARLVKDFHRNRDTYLSSTYIERAARNEFIDPLFIALGWDVRNEQRAVPTYRDVDLEESLEGERRKQSPDYTFRIVTERKFLAEAKKPHVSIKTDPAPAQQLRSYGWNAKLPLSILTDFEEFAIYDCRKKPSEYDLANVARVEYLTYDQYPDVWRKIWDAFSREAVLSRGYDEFAEHSKSKRGTLTVDDDFLDTIENWRKALAQNIAPRNLALTVPQLNDAVQRTIDRIIFLRIAEDRDIEPYQRLQEVASGDGVYRRLLDLFKQANAKYNAGLFDFAADESDTRKLVIDDKVLRSLIADLYTVYNFRMMPVEILGNVYEQFLGKVIHLTPTHQARIEEKPAVRKAGGVYYTPAYIVDYIVRNTVGKLVEGNPVPQATPADAHSRVAQGMSPKEVARLRVLDMACGSGSFLLGAYQFLLAWHLQWYAEHEPQKQKAIYDATHGTRDPEWHLTTAEKKRILVNNIYGVDIDRQAVEVTKLSLLLKVLEDEQAENFAPQFAEMRAAHERVLPNLDANIKCGNSLIGTDYFAGREHDEEELRRVNPFDWAREYPDVMKAGGFDCVIGNPPYGAEMEVPQKDYFHGKFEGESRSYDTYELFLLMAKRLLRDDGHISMIIPSSWLTGEKYEASRQKLVTELYPSVAYALPFDVFKDAYIDTAIVVLSSAITKNCLIHFFPKKERLISIPTGIGKPVPIENIRTDSQSRLSPVLAQETASLLQKLDAPKTTFGDWFEISRGVQPYARSKHTEEQIRSRFLHASIQKSKRYMPELQGSELSRYFIAPERTSFIKYSDDIASTRPIKMFVGKRVVLRRLLTRKFRLQASVATDTMITTDNVLNMIPQSAEASVEFCLAILNSKLISWAYVNTSMIAQKDDFPQVHISALSSIHLPEYDLARHHRMVSLVTQMLDLHQRLHAATSASDRELLQRQIDATDKAIDALVYELYGLTAEEISIIEKT